MTNKPHHNSSRFYHVCTMAIDQQQEMGYDATIVSVERNKTTRIEFEFPHDQVAILNERGIIHLSSGKVIEAKRSFTRALYQATASIFSASGMDISCPFVVGDTNIAAEGAACDCDHQISCAAEPVDTSLYIYQREDYDEGMHVYRGALNIDRDVRRPWLDATLLYNVGQANVRSKQYSEAMRCFELALKLLDGESMRDNGPCISAYKVHHNIGNCYYRLGENNRAMAHYKAALTLAEESTLCKLDLAASYNCIAVLHFHNSTDDAEKALDLLAQSISIYRSIIGSDSSELAVSLSNYGRVHYLLSEYEKALPLFQESLSIRERLLGSSDINVATALYNVGQTQHRLGNLKEAKRCYTQFLAVAQMQLGNKHRDFAAGMKSLGDVHREEGDKTTALTMLKQALASGKSALGKWHPELCCTLNDLGSLFYEMDSFRESLHYYQECLALQRRILTPDHPHIMITLLNIAQIYKQSDDCNSAFQIYREIYSTQVRSLDPSCLEIASTLSSMGLMRYMLKDFRGALTFYSDALSIRRDHFGTNLHQDIASTLNSIGLVCFKLNMHQPAKDAFMECIEVRKALRGPYCSELSILWYNLATVYLESGEDDEAIKLYEESLRVERHVLGLRHPEVAVTVRHLGQVYQERGDFATALSYLKQALDIERSHEEKDISSSCKLLTLIGGIHLMRGEVDQMMAYFVEACRLLGQDGQSLAIAGHSFYDLSKLHPPCAPTA